METDIPAVPSPERKSPKLISLIRTEFDPAIELNNQVKTGQLKLLTSGLNRINTIGQVLIENPLQTETSNIHDEGFKQIKKSLNAMRMVFAEFSNSPIQPSSDGSLKTIDEAKAYLSDLTSQLITTDGIKPKQTQPEVQLPITTPDHLEFALGDFDILNHDLGNEIFTLTTELDSFQRGIPGSQDAYVEIMDELADKLNQLPHHLKEPFAKILFPVIRLEGLADKRLNTLLQDKGIKYQTLGPFDRGEQFRRVIWSEVWARSLIDNLVQNVLRKSTGQPPPTEVEIEITPNESNTHLVFMFRDNGYKIPQHIVENGFLEGEGENKDGEHLAMGRLRKIIEKQYQGKMIAENIEIDGTNFAQIRVEIPYTN